MTSKENDLMLNILANPQMNLGDFQSIGFSVDNTSLEDENVYLNSSIITENPMFQNSNGEFDKVKFHLKYLEAAQAMLMLATESSNQSKNIYSKYNIFAPINLIDTSPQFELVKALNPDRLTKSMLVLGQSGPREYSPAEIAQSQQIYDSKTGKWIDSPEDLFSFGKLFSDFTGFINDNFGSTKVLATYDEDVDINGKIRGQVGFDENLIEHHKGEYKLNDNGTYYYRTLKDGEDIYGKQLLHYSDILTREGSALNAVDFLDSDDIQKTPLGSFVKDAALIGSFFLPYVGQYIAGATILQQAAGLGATLGKIALQDNNNSTMNWLEGFVESTNPMETRSEHSLQENWTLENLLGMVGDVVGQLYQQRLLFKYAPVVFKGKWGVSEKSQEALKNKIIGELKAENKAILSDAVKSKDLLRYKKIESELHANAVDEAARQLESYMQSYYKTGEQLSKAYMTMLTVNDIYAEAKEAGADDFDAALVTAGYAAMEYALLSTDIGKWVLPELRANRLLNKAIVKALSKDTLDTFDKLKSEAATSEAARRSYIKTLVDKGKSIAKAVIKGDFASGWGKRASIEGGKDLLSGGFGSLFAGAAAEAVEETSEELLGDFSRVLFNGLEQLKGKDTRLKPFENAFDRYTMSFLGGFLGGGISSYSMDFSEARKNANMSYNQAVLEVIYKARNGQLDGLYKILDKETVGNEKLSATKIIDDGKGNTIWREADGNDNQDFVIKQNIKRFLNLVLNTLEAHGGNLSDLSMLNAQTLKDIRYRALHQSVTAGEYIQKYNELTSDLVLKTFELKQLNSPQEKAEEGETDKKDDKSPELEKRRKKLEEEIKSIDKQIEDFNSGKLAPLFMTSALLESTPFISSPFMTSTFKLFAEQKAKTSFENITKEELKKYLIEYQNYLRTSKKDDLKLATAGYLSVLDLIRKNLKESEQATELDSELKEYLTEHYNILSTFSLNILGMDDDTWVEKLQLFSQEAQVGEQVINNLLLLRNTIKENNNLSKEKYNKSVSDANLAFESGLIDEETKNNTISNAEKEYDQEIKYNQNLFNKQRELVITQSNILSANDLADKIIKYGYVNGSIKSNIIALLNSAKNTAITLRNQLEDEINSGEDLNAQDFLLNLYENINQQINTLDSKISKINELPYTPILQNLDTFALGLNGSNISSLLQFFGDIVNSNRNTLSAFTMSRDNLKQLNEAIRTIDLYIAALEGARVDTVDPFKIGINSKGEAVDKTNVWGINKVLNEVHAKSPKIEDDTWVDLPEIQGETADMMIMDAKSIKKLLTTYKRLYNINESLKLNIQTRVAARTTYLLYDRIRRLLTNVDLKDFNTSEILKTFNELSFLEQQTSGNKEEWNINLNKQLQILLEKERIMLEDAIYNFFNVDNPSLSQDVEKLLNFLEKGFNLNDSRTELLTEGSNDIDDTSMIGYIATKAAIKSSDFHGKYINILDGKTAPIISQELSAQLQLANVLNGNVISAFSAACRNSMINSFKNADFNKRIEILKKYGENELVARLFATEEGSKYYPSHDSVMLFSNITFIDGVPGAGKSAAVDALVIKYLQQYHKDLTNNIWVAHGGDSENDTAFASNFRKSIGLDENPDLTFSRKKLMEKLSGEWKYAKIENGKSYKIEDSDYTFENEQIVPTWKLNNITESELPSLIVIDEGQQFTQLDLLLIDKFAKKHGIPVIISGDLQLSNSTGQFELPKETLDKINQELKKNGLEEFSAPILMDIKLSRNLTLHTPKLGTSMRTSNNLKNANMAAMQAVFEGEQSAILHYYEDENNITGDILANPNDTDFVIKIIDKIIPKLEDGEKINYAFSNKDSKLYKILTENKKYFDRINFIEGVALGQEGNYWIIEPSYSIVDDAPFVENIEDFKHDLYTGITRSKIAGIVVSPENLNNGNFIISNTLDYETHEIHYSPESISKYAKNRESILKEILKDTNDIEYKPRNKYIEPVEPTTSIVVKEEKSEGEKAFEKRVEEISTEEIDVENLSGTFIDKYKKLIELEILDPVYFSVMGREVLVANINGVKVPFYKSSSGTDGKTKGKWFPIFGVGTGAKTDDLNELDWLIKGEIEDMENGYYIPEIQYVQNLLNKYFVWEPDTFRKSEHGVFGKPTGSTELLNIMLFGKPNINVKNGVNAMSHIEQFLERIRNGQTIENPVEESEESEEIETTINLDSTNEKRVLAILSESESSDNHEPIIEPKSHFQKFDFFLFSNASFLLGTNRINREQNTYELSENQRRIDGVNGLRNCPNGKKYLGNLSESERFLGTLFRMLLKTKNKSDLEKNLATRLGFKENVYVRFAIKTSEHELVKDQSGNIISTHPYNKLENDPTEVTPYTRAQGDSDSESNYINNRYVCAIIGTETNGDAIEIPLLTLNNPITILKIHDNQTGFRYNELYKIYNSTYNKVFNGQNQAEAQTAGLKAILTSLEENDDLKEYSDLVNLIKLYTRTIRNIVFINDPNWTPSNNLISHGPQLHIQRGWSYDEVIKYDNKDYVLEERWISLDELKSDPTLYVSNVYHLTDKSKVKLAHPKHPVVFYTDSIYGHDGSILNNDKAIIEEFMWEYTTKKSNNIKILYVLPPKFTLLEYLNSLHIFMDVNKDIKPLGNQRTAYKIWETLLTTDVDTIEQLFINTFGKDTGKQLFEKISSVVYNLKDKDIKEQIRLLLTKLKWPNFNGVGLTTEVHLYRHLLHILKQLVYPAGVTIEGSISLKGDGKINQKAFDILNTTFDKSDNSTLYYQTKSSKNLTDTIEVFSPVQEINDPNILDKKYTVRANISSTTFLTNLEFNDIINYIVNNTQYSENDMLKSKDNRNYTGTWYGEDGDFLRNKYPRGYSGWLLSVEDNNSISQSILDKLNRFGINTKEVPNSKNDDSLYLKQRISEEINLDPLNKDVLALALPNGEFLLANFNHDGPIILKFDNAFESNQQYQFELKINDETYDVVYNPITKIAEIKNNLSEVSFNYNSYYEETTPEFVEQNLAKFKNLLKEISDNDSFSEDSRNIAKELLIDSNPSEISAFLNDTFGIMEEMANINDFDKAKYNDILKFEQLTDNSCQISLKINFE